MSWLQMPWGKMHYTEAGRAGVPLVLLHGTGCDSRDWDAVARELPREMRTIRVDFRGHGKSEVPGAAFALEDLARDVMALADHLSIPHLTLAGHSLGGMVAMSVAMQSPRVAGLVLLEGWTQLRACEAFTGNRFYGRLDPASIASVRRKNERTRKRFDPEIWDRFWASVETFDALAFLRSAGMPVLEVYGDMGRTGATRRRLLIPDNPSIRLVWISHAGHYLPHERPREVAELALKVTGWRQA